MGGAGRPGGGVVRVLARILSAVAVAVPVLLGLWFALAYGELPRLWSRHEHKVIGRSDRIVSYTSQDIPGDPVNLLGRAGADQLDRAYAAAGWSRADPVTVASGVRIAVSVVAARPYPAAPVSPLYLQDLAYEWTIGDSADRRHHVRFWQVRPGGWAGAASLDRGVGLSLYTLEVTHHIGPDVDAERAASGRILAAAGGRGAGWLPNHIPAGIAARNGGGDHYRTDGWIAAWAFAPAPAPGR